LSSREADTTQKIQLSWELRQNFIKSVSLACSGILARFQDEFLNVKRSTFIPVPQVPFGITMWEGTSITTGTSFPGLEVRALIAHVVLSMKFNVVFPFTDPITFFGCWFLHNE